MQKPTRFNNRGFSLIELSIGLLLLSIIAGSVVPNFVLGIRQQAARKTALEISQVQEAARKYYIDKGSWPADFPTLAANYLDPTWSAANVNPFGQPYSVNINVNNLNVVTIIPHDVSAVTGANLQGVTITPIVGTPNDTFQSFLTPPGAQSVLLPGTIIPWALTSIPSGYLLCNGQPVLRTGTFAALFAAIGTTYGAGDGSTTFNVPDLRGRTIVGLNRDASDGSNRVWSTDTNYAGTPIYSNVAAIGGVFGEEKHTQTIAELVPHSHQYVQPPPEVHGFSGESTTAPRGDDYTANTSNSGGGMPANVVQPSMALEYIIKT